MTKYYQITGAVGAGYTESAYFNPSESVWETRSMDSSRYTIQSLAEAERFLEIAKADNDVTGVEIEEISIEE